ncbi:hypothetical protein TW81_17345 [Vibrio galatheae]|uniref:Uncharacterized protein n=1 Tax=Vibrio galatheae TaxID=579748 RepID=A0A0F4NFG2_9VIBR|nr:hypothetical protein [Vibrio galatheae]KJY81674.1 hypothetical protein TW81_17345 [Vibrio galatheae]
MITSEQALTKIGLFRANDERYLKFYWGYLGKNFDRIMGLDCQDKRELQHKISMVFMRTDLDVIGLVNRLNTAALDSLVPEKSFDWIDKNDDRVVYFVWSMLRLATPRALKIDGRESGLRYARRLDDCLYYIDSKRSNYYKSLKLNPLPMHRSEALPLIKDFFDQWNVTARSKEELMLTLKEKWLYIASDLRPDYSWIDPKNKQQNAWASNYISSQLEWLPHLPPPLTTSQTYNINIANLDTLFTFNKGQVRNPSERDDKKKTEYKEWLSHTDVMHKMMKAWKQKQFREKARRASAKS